MTIPTRQLLTLLARFADGYGSTDAAVGVAVEAYEAGYKDGRDYEAKSATIRPGTALAFIIHALASGQKLQAIKAFRTATNGGLKEGKDFIEMVAALNDIGGF